MDFQSNLSMMESIDFEEKVDIDDLVLPSKPSKMGTMEILDVKEEPLEENSVLLLNQFMIERSNTN
jgi:hypothetical protein